MRYRLVSILIEGKDPAFRIEGKPRGFLGWFSSWDARMVPPGYDFDFMDFDEAVDAFEELTKGERTTKKTVKEQS